MENYSVAGARSNPQFGISPIIDSNERVEEMGPYRGASKNPLISTTTEEPSSQKFSADEGNFVTISSKGAATKPWDTFMDVFNDWVLEIWCCILALGTIVAMWRTLAPLQDELLPNWPQGISVNSVISLYVLMLKACLFVILSAGIGQLKWNWFEQVRPLHDIEKFDEASRGPIGAVKLLWALRGRNPVAGVAAFIFVVAVGIDPFSQQIVRFYPCESDSVTLNATISRTNMYVGEPGGIHIGADLNTIALGMQSAINIGLFNPGSLPIPLTCPSRNCTFPNDYSSFGFCSNCTDISEQLNVTLSDGPTRYSNFTLPSGLFASPWYQKTFVMGPDNGTTYTYQAILGNLGEDGKPIPGFLDCTPSTPWGCRGYGAAECKIYPCIKTYYSYVEAGQLYEEILGESPEKAWGTDDVSSSRLLSMIDATCLNFTQGATLRKLGYNILDSLIDGYDQGELNTDRYMPYNTSFVPPRPANMTQALLANISVPDINPACIYQTTTTYIRSLATALAPILTGSAFLAPSALGGTTPAMSALFNSGNVSTASLTSHFANITDSMTAFIRQHGTPGRSEPASGYITEPATCVGVQWKWMSFPILLVLGTVGVFAAMVGKTRMRGGVGKGFKSKALPLVLHGLEERVVDGFGMEVNERGEGMRRIGGMRVRLGLTERGWRFVEVEKG